MEKLAPIVLFVYNRPEHTALTLNALKVNSLASESELFIFCDGPKPDASSKTLQDIDAVRKLVRTEQWCKRVTLYESETNKGLAKSIQPGVTEIVERFGKVIVMEDDLRTSPAFLSYMNSALDFYEHYSSVFSISAYNLPASKMPIPKDYAYDVYVSYRNGSWGWATWKDRWAKVDWNVKAYETIKSNPSVREAFGRAGDDVFNMLQQQQEGKLNIWSIQFTVAHFVYHAVSIVPVVSFVDNIGLDGTGENCGVHSTLKNNTLNESKTYRFPEVLYEDKRLINGFFSANSSRKRPLWKKAINRVSRMLGFQNVFVLKDKVFQ